MRVTCLACKKGLLLRLATQCLTKYFMFWFSLVLLEIQTVFNMVCQIREKKKLSQLVPLFVPSQPYQLLQLKITFYIFKQSKTHRLEM